MKYNKKSIITCLCLSVLIFFSCSNEDEFGVKTEESVIPSPEKPVEVVNGVLKFANSNQMGTTLFELHEMTNEEFESMERINYKGFTSQRTLFNAIRNAELELVNKYKDAKTEVEKQQILDKGYSDLYIAKRTSGFIVESIDENGYSSFDYSILRPLFTPIVNEKGFYAIGDTIYQITSIHEKSWINGDFKNLSILDRTTVSDSTMGITVKTKLELRGSKKLDTDWCTNGSYRFKVSYDFQANPITMAQNIWQVGMAVNFGVQHLGGMWPFKKWDWSEPWPISYSVRRQAQTLYAQSFPPYGIVMTADPVYRTPSSGTNYVKGNNVWKGFCPFSDQETRSDQTWMAYKNVAYNGMAQLQQIIDIYLVDLEIYALFEGRKKIIVTLDKFENIDTNK